jgi:hypothetical protein
MEFEILLRFKFSFSIEFFFSQNISVPDSGRRQQVSIHGYRTQTEFWRMRDLNVNQDYNKADCHFLGSSIGVNSRRVKK